MCVSDIQYDWQAVTPSIWIIACVFRQDLGVPTCYLLKSVKIDFHGV